ncbi:hypothetical protein [Bradyrhizobium sp. CCGUVB23]|uniref:hypothetical protein n=1 Tax=Bradyrhizobium sp. CCGUVB23 TaxID=2949630 RepID=UPI0020B1856C|nr:hypothetical protein [Bradyrhizobium sp. CCGUVB23]MCP3459586.1 hypothetical protein [Bradyrhizobium sp. CCGUVB23]
MGRHQHVIDELKKFERLCLDLADDSALPEERADLRSLAINNRLGTAIGGLGAPADFDTGQRTQTWLA